MLDRRDGRAELRGDREQEEPEETLLTWPAIAVILEEIVEVASGAPDSKSWLRPRGDA